MNECRYAGCCAVQAQGRPCEMYISPQGCLFYQPMPNVSMLNDLACIARGFAVKAEFTAANVDDDSDAQFFNQLREDWMMFADKISAALGSCRG